MDSVTISLVSCSIPNDCDESYIMSYVLSGSSLSPAGLRSSARLGPIVPPFPREAWVVLCNLSYRAGTTQSQVVDYFGPAGT